MALPDEPLEILEWDFTTIMKHTETPKRQIERIYTSLVEHYIGSESYTTFLDGWEDATNPLDCIEIKYPPISVEPLWKVADAKNFTLDTSVSDWWDLMKAVAKKVAEQQLWT